MSSYFNYGIDDDVRYNSTRNIDDGGIDELLREHGMETDGNYSDDDYSNFDMIESINEYHSEVQTALTEMFENNFQHLRNGSGIEALQEEEAGFFAKVKARIISVWNKIVSVFSGLVNRVRSAMFGKLKGHINEIKAAISSGNMDYKKAVKNGKGRWHDLSNLDKLATGFMKICKDVKEKIASLAGGGSVEFSAVANFSSRRDSRDLGSGSGNHTAGNIAKQFLQTTARTHLADIMTLKTNKFTGSSGYAQNNLVNKSGEIGASTSNKFLNNESAAQSAFKAAADEILPMADKALNTLEKSLASLKNDVNKIVAGLENNIGKGTYSDKSSTSAGVRTTRTDTGNKSVVYKKTMNIHEVTNFAHSILALADSIVNNITTAVRNNVLLMKSCITSGGGKPVKESAEDNIFEELFDLDN